MFEQAVGNRRMRRWRNEQKSSLLVQKPVETAGLVENLLQKSAQARRRIERSNLVERGLQAAECLMSYGP